MRNYIPDRGDAVWINMNPQAGHEQSGRRPAVVLSPSSYNGKVGLALFCPVTNKDYRINKMFLPLKRNCIFKASS